MLLTVHVFLCIEIASTLLKSYLRAIEGLESAKAAFALLDSSVDEHLRALWTKQSENASENREQDLANLDVYAIQWDKGQAVDHVWQSALIITSLLAPTKQQVQLLLTEKERSFTGRGLIDWISEGLAIEETQ